MNTPNLNIRRLLCLAAGLLLVPLVSARPGLREFAESHCFDCHDSTTHKAGLDLEKLDPSFTGKDALVWESVFDRVRLGDMPPKKKAQPKPEERAGFLDALGKELQAASYQVFTFSGVLGFQQIV